MTITEFMEALTQLCDDQRCLPLKPEHARYGKLLAAPAVSYQTLVAALQTFVKAVRFIFLHGVCMV